MKGLKDISLVILEAILFGSLGGLFGFVSLYLLHYFTFEAPSGNISIHIIPLYQLINFPLIIIILSFSFVFGRIILKLLKQSNLQWFYNLIFFIIATIFLQIYVIYDHLQQMGLPEHEPFIEWIFQVFDIRLNALIIIFSMLFSLLYQIIKTRFFSKP